MVGVRSEDEGLSGGGGGGGGDGAGGGGGDLVDRLPQSLAEDADDVLGLAVVVALGAV